MRGLALLTLGIWLLPVASAAQDVENVEAGRRIFAQRCAGCHGAGGEGRETTERTFSVELRHLASPEVQERTDEEFRVLLLEGGRLAKPVRNLSPSDAGSVIRFLRTLRVED